MRLLFVQVLYRSATISRPTDDPDKQTYVRNKPTTSDELSVFVEGNGLTNDTRVEVLEERSVRGTKFALVDSHGGVADARGWVKAKYLCDFEECLVDAPPTANGATDGSSDDESEDYLCVGGFKPMPIASPRLHTG